MDQFLEVVENDLHFIEPRIMTQKAGNVMKDSWVLVNLGTLGVSYDLRERSLLLSTLNQNFPMKFHLDTLPGASLNCRLTIARHVQMHSPDIQNVLV